MGYFSNLAIEILDLHAAGVSNKDIASQCGVSEQEVAETIESDYDADPSEYAERSADLDAEFYGVQ